MQIDDRLINYLEDLSHITLCEQEKQRVAGDLEKILHYMDRLGEIDTEGIPECTHPFDDVNSFREDRVSESFDRTRIMHNAPEMEDGMFIAPKNAGI